MRGSNRSLVDFTKDPKLLMFQRLINECFAVNTTHSEVFSVDSEQSEGKLVNCNS